jgi:hypothetical protein
MSEGRMIDGRIVFPGNPWPEGHPIEEFEWTARIEGGDLWFDLHLRSAEYDSERQFDADDENEEDEASSWEAPIVWNNYHRCTLYSTFWGEQGGFRVCAIDAFSLAWLDGRAFAVDPVEAEIEDADDRPFHIYLLGHDSVANHRVEFRRVAGSDIDGSNIDSSDAFDILWSGDIALSYVGDSRLEHRFEARIARVPCPAIPALSDR